MFLLDDILMNMLGISVPGLDLFSTLNLVKDMAYRELYDPEKIKNEIKENRLLYEFGEIPAEVYNTRKNELMEQLEYVQQLRAANVSFL
ncbi:gas vesicle protein GvpG [Methanosarcina sp. Mfa9]|uniref:gas vesicle protein GvpG n=1 Tax=Methanosarcina sp. Mfa9 TaxID=3439063 RepID=UPI003F841E31